MGLFPPKKSKYRIIAIPQNRSVKVSSPVVNTPPVIPQISCGCSSTSATSQNQMQQGATLRGVKQNIQISGNYSNAIPKQGILEFELENTSIKNATEVILFDALRTVETAFGIDAIPTDVTMTDIRKNYEAFIEAVIARDTYTLAKIELTVINGSSTQTLNPFYFHVGHHFTDDQTLIGEVSPDHFIDRANQRNVDYASMPVDQMIDPRFGMKFRLEKGTKIRLRFVFNALVGSDR